VDVLVRIVGDAVSAVAALGATGTAAVALEGKLTALGARTTTIFGAHGEVLANVAQPLTVALEKTGAAAVTAASTAGPALSTFGKGLGDAGKAAEDAAQHHSLLGAVVTGLGGMLTSLGGAVLSPLTGHYKSVGDATKDLNEKSNKLREGIEKLAGAAEKTVTGKSSVFGLLSGLGSSIPLIGGVVAGVGILGALLEHLVVEQADYAFTIEEQNQLLGVNTTLLQTLDEMVTRVGLDHDNLTKILQRFGTNLEKGAPALKAYGLNLADLGITSKDLNVAIPEFSKWLSEQTNKTYANAVATALLGKGASDLITTFGKGPDAIKAFTAEMQRNGQIMSEDEIHAGALTKIFKDDMMASLQGVVRQLAGPLFAGLDQLFHAITLGRQQMGGVFHDLGQGISNVLTQIVSFFVSLTRGKAGIDAFNKSLGDSSAAYKENALRTADATRAAAQKKVDDLEAKVSLDALTQSTADQTKALDASIKTLNDRQTAFDTMIGKEITGYTDASTAFTKKADKEIADLNNASAAYAKNADEQIQTQHDIVTALDQRMAMEQLQQQLADDAGTSELARLKAQLGAATNMYSDQRKAGETVAAFQQRLRVEGLQDQITAEEQRRALAKDTAAIEKAQVTDAADAVIKQLNDQKAAYADETKVRIDTLNLQKQAYADDTAARIASLNTQKTAYDDDTKARVAALDAQKTALQDNLSAQQRSYNDLTSTMQDQLAQAQSDLLQAQTGYHDILTGNTNSFLSNLQLAFSDPGSTLQSWANWLGDALGTALVNGLISGLERAVGYMVSGGGIIGMLPNLVGNATVGLAQGLWHSITGRQSGGPIVPGQPYLIGEHGPELRVFDQPGAILPLTTGGLTAVQAGGGLGGGALTINQTVHITGSSEEMQTVARREIDRANTQLLQRIVATA
jgi:hypothetical protein